MSLIALATYLPIPAGAKYFTLKDDRTYYSINGALSFGFFDETISDGVNRIPADLSASVIGRAWAVEAVGGFPAATEVPESFDSRIQGVPPANLTETHTFIVFMSAADGTGNAVAMCPWNLFEQFSPAIPVRY